MNTSNLKKNPIIDTKYGRNLSTKGRNEAWISCDLDITTTVPKEFFIVLRDGIHAVSTPVNEELLTEWLDYIKVHKDKPYQETKN